MRVLVVGGTRFIGRHIVAALRQSGHTVTLLNRGQTHPEILPGLPRIHLDRRTDDLGALRTGADWDAVIDMIGMFPADVDRFLEAIDGHIGRYVYCSTVSVYAGFDADLPRLPVLRETSPMLTCSADEAVAAVPETYGRRKAACEAVVGEWRQRGLESVILRPSVVYGAWDHTDRMAYWIWRATQGQPFVLPDAGLNVFARTYAPDLAKVFLRACTEPAMVGEAFNVAESETISWRDTLIACGRAIGIDALTHAVNVPSEALLAEDAELVDEFPLWLPGKHLFVDTAKLRTTIAWEETAPDVALAAATSAFLAEGRPPTAGMSAARENRLLASLSAAAAVMP